MTDADFEYLRALLKSRSGLSLAPEKRYLVESRLGPVCRKHQIPGLPQLVQVLRGGRNSAIETEVVEAMTTNETFFFRDKTPFDIFRDQLLPKLAAARATQKRLRIWCAAASTGQEPYSLAMIVDEMKPRLGGVQVDILATDLADEVLAKAKAGVYSQFEVQRGLPIQMLLKHFKQDGEQWRISPAIKNMVQFRPLNLIRDFSSLGQFDIVFCRNVLIYFDQPTKADVLRRLSNALAADGALFLGAAETVIGLTSAFQPHPEHRGLYVPARAQPAAGAPRLAASA
ncbi:CheR family methyltransferase [Salinarimonas chemoclinalis]|uniref:CheR family methyltransferase n=1 Tax=Salinarimonas chemoclinalis TaxID=3241599 RepID=UPI0035568AB4